MAVRDTDPQAASDAGWENAEAAAGRFAAAVRDPGGEGITGVAVAWCEDTGRGFFRTITPDAADKFADNLHHAAAEVRARTALPVPAAQDLDADGFLRLPPTNRL